MFAVPALRHLALHATDRPVRILHPGQLLSDSSLTNCWRVNLRARLLICRPVLAGRERLYTRRWHLSPVARDVASTPRVVVQFIGAAAAARDVRDVYVIPGRCCDNQIQLFEY